MLFTDYQIDNMLKNTEIHHLLSIDFIYIYKLKNKLQK